MGSRWAYDFISSSRLYPVGHSKKITDRAAGNWHAGDNSYTATTAANWTAVNIKTAATYEHNMKKQTSPARRRSGRIQYGFPLNSFIRSVSKVLAGDDKTGEKKKANLRVIETELNAIRGDNLDFRCAIVQHGWKANYDCFKRDELEYPDFLKCEYVQAQYNRTQNHNITLTIQQKLQGM